MNPFADLKATAEPADVARAWGLDPKKSGKLLTAWCPFHTEKDAASFTIYPLATGRPGYKCFGCGWNGSVIDLVAARENLDPNTPADIAKAAALIAGKLGLPWQSEKPRTPQEQSAREAALEAERAARALRDACYLALEVAALWFRALLLDPKTEGARLCRQYAEGRGLGPLASPPAADPNPPARGPKPQTPPAPDPWCLGYAPEDRQLIGWLEHEGIPQPVRLAAGLTGLSDPAPGREPYEYLRGAHRGERLVLPIRDPAGRVVAFTGRILPHGEERARASGRLKPGQAPAKYVNTPESRVWSKGEILYGLPQAAPHIRRTGRAAVVEGHLDVVSCHQAALHTIVGCQGSTLTEGQARVLLGAGCTDCVVLPDSDAWEADPQTGRTKWDFGRLLEVCSEVGLPVRVGRMGGEA